MLTGYLDIADTGLKTSSHHNSGTYVFLKLKVIKGLPICFQKAQE